MKIISKTLIVTLLASCLIFAMTTSAFAVGSTGNITVNCNAGRIGGIFQDLYLPIANIYVYGPNGYYGHQYCGGSLELLPRLVTTRSYVFKNCPNGNYRVRVVWKGGIEQNQYPGLNWWCNSKTLNFTPPK